MASAVPVRIDEQDEKLFRIGEVSRLTGVKAFVLRYWEQEIPALQPVKTLTGHRLYRREDINMVFEIKRLLYEQGYTLAGARKHLGGGQVLTDSHAGSETLAEAMPPQDFTLTTQPVPAGPRPLRLSAARQKTLLDLHEELLAILTLLEGE